MNKTIIRNTAQTLTWTKAGDYSSDTIKFTVKADRTLTSSRLIDETASASHSSGVTTFTVTLTPSDSALLNSDLYYYDLRVENDSTDRELLHSGLIYLDKSVRNDSDGSSVTIPDADLSAFKTALGLPDKVYKAFINCGGTNDPTVTVVKNTFDDTITVARQDVGVFTITSNSSEFTSNKTIAIAQPKTLLDPIVVGVTLSTSIVTCLTYNDSDALADSLDFWVSIEVYI